MGLYNSNNTGGAAPGSTSHVYTNYLSPKRVHPPTNTSANNYRRAASCSTNNSVYGNTNTNTTTSNKSNQSHSVLGKSRKGFPVRINSTGNVVGSLYQALGTTMGIQLNVIHESHQESGGHELGASTSPLLNDEYISNSSSSNNNNHHYSTNTTSYAKNPYSMFSSFISNTVNATTNTANNNTTTAKTTTNTNSNTYTEVEDRTPLLGSNHSINSNSNNNMNMIVTEETSV